MARLDASLRRVKTGFIDRIGGVSSPCLVGTLSDHQLGMDGHSSL